MNKLFDMNVCEKYCPYLNGKKPRFSMLKILDNGELVCVFFPVNGLGMKYCIKSKKTAPFMIGKEVTKWMEQNIDVFSDLTQCPCKCEHCIIQSN